MTMYDDDVIDLKGANVDRLAVRVYELLSDEPARVLYGLPVGIAAAVPVVSDGCTLLGLVANNAGAADATLVVGGPDVTAAAFHDALTVPAGGYARAVPPNRGLRMVSGLWALALTGPLTVTAWYSLD